MSFTASSVFGLRATSVRPRATGSLRRPAPGYNRQHVKPRALLPMETFQIAEAAVGSVDAPLPVIIGAVIAALMSLGYDWQAGIEGGIEAVLVTIASATLVPLLLKPGDDAARVMQERDSRKWNNYE